MSSRLPNPLPGPRARRRAITPARLARLGRGHRAGGVTPVEQAADPAVKTSSPRHAPRDAERAAGGIRAWARIPAAGPAPLRLYSHSVRAYPNLKKSARTVSAAIGGLAASRRRPPPTTPAPPNENSSARMRLGVISPREYGVKNGRRRDSHARKTAGPSSRLRRCGHRARRDPRGGLRLCVCHRVDSGSRWGARGKACFGFNARPTRIAAQQPRRRATPAAAPLRAAGWNSDLNQLSRPARRAARQPRPPRA
jgi:hypothetical protein